MKKTLLLFVAFATISLTAQVTMYLEDFNDEDISDWTIIDSDGDTNNWGDSFVVNDGAGNPVTPISMISRSWLSTGVLTPDNWAITPAIDLSNASGLIELTYITQVPAASWDEEHYTVYIATSNDIVNLQASPLFLEETLGDAGDTGTPENKTVDISAMAGEPVVYVAFRHHNVSDMDFISIDDVLVEAASVANVNDNILASSVKMYPTATSESFTINNQSNIALTSVSLYDVNGRVVLTNSLDNLIGKKSINVANLSSGLYFVEISSADAKLVKKLIIK